MGKDDQTNQPDDGFNAEERAAWAEMQANSGADAEIIHDGEDDPAPPGGDDPQPNNPADIAAAAQANQADGDDDDDDDDDPAPAPAPKDGEPQPERPKKRVSARKYQAAVEELETLRTQLSERDTNLARVNERLAIINEAFGQRKPAAAQPGAEPAPEPEQKGPPDLSKVQFIDPEADIFGAFNQVKDLLVQYATSTTQSVSQIQQQAREQQEYQSLRSEFENGAKEFIKAEPAFTDAYQYLMGARAIQLADLWFDKTLDDNAPAAKRLTPEEFQRIQTQVLEEERQIVADAVKSKRNPAQVIFKLARNMGFAPKKADPAPQQQQGDPPAAKVPGNLAEAARAGDQPAPQQRQQPQQPAAKTNVSQEIARIKNNKDGMGSLSDGAGAPPSQLTADMLANMSDAEFERMMGTLTQDQIDELMGAGV